MKINKLTTLLILLSFVSGFLFRHSKPVYLVDLKNKLKYELKEIFFLKDSSNRFCPKKISKLPENSTLVIGHAYGSHSKSFQRGDVGIAPKVYDFYLNNKQNINSIIFSGDVLKEPSIKKWKDFYHKFKGNTKIFIAPGNHDVGGVHFDSALRDIFNLVPHKNQKEKSFPFKITLNKSQFIIGDSNSEENSLDEIILNINKEVIAKNIFVVIHHIFPEGLQEYSNAQGRHGLIKDSYFEEKFNNNKKVYFLYGDGGAFADKPRYKCIKLANSYHIVGGIGELPGDTIFVIHNNNLYRMEI